MPCWTKLEIRLSLQWPAKNVIAAVSKLQGWSSRNGLWFHQDGTKLNVEGDKAVLVGANPKAHVRSITTEIIRQHALQYGWRVQNTPLGLKLTK